MALGTNRFARAKVFKDPIFNLSGSTLHVYMILLTSKKPLGIREIQRIAGFKSPNSARHHIEKLMELGYVSRTRDGYIAVKPRSSLLSAFVVLKDYLIPRTLFYALATTIFLIAYVLLKIPNVDWYSLIFIAAINILLWRDSIVLLDRMNQIKKAGIVSRVR